MRALVPPAVALALSAAIVLVGGRMIGTSADVDPSDDPGFVIDQEDLPDLQALPEPQHDQPAVSEEAAPEEVPTREGQAAAAPQVPAQLDTPQSESDMPAAALQPVLPVDESAGTAASRMVVPEIIAPPEFAGGQLSREPLGESDIASRFEKPILPDGQEPPVAAESTAKSPETEAEWAGKPLFRPVAVESAMVEAMGHTISISGVSGLKAEDSCDFEGESWPCGVRARAAFRSWLRGRALVCEPTDETSDAPGSTRASCRLANQDVGAWLVENGWARAAPDGPYAGQEGKARAAGLGIFGGPPDTASLAPAPDLPVLGEGQFGASEILNESDPDPQPTLDPRMAFPPPPPPPVP